MDGVAPFQFGFEENTLLAAEYRKNALNIQIIYIFYLFILMFPI